MESDGNEKRIQALYSELSFENQSMAPQFEHLWTAAVSKRPEARSAGIAKALLIAAAVAAIACSVGVWSWYRLRASAPQNVVQRLPEPARPKAVPGAEPNFSVSGRRGKPRRTSGGEADKRREASKKVVLAQTQMARQKVVSAQSQAAMLLRWQSPTARLMESPTELVPTSLPQLNQSVKELQSFLPRTNEIMKESNR